MWSRGATSTCRPLKAIGSTGSPLPPEGFEWVYEHVKKDLWLFSTSGGTDLCTAFIGGVPLLPVRTGELQARSLGAKVEAFDPDGEPLIDEVGELVITEPMPSMPIYFWNDEGPFGERYRESYFEMYPGVWRHGDWIQDKAYRGVRHPRPLRFDHKPRRRDDGNRRDLLRRREGRRGSRRVWS